MKNGIVFLGLPPFAIPFPRLPGGRAYPFRSYQHPPCYGKRHAYLISLLSVV